ncbi:hypothetical protein [Aeromonas rivipollensis]|uniref:hypothetical protein n=1 Tax=Aeromonas rivipollensis TaxID=948519 RepID=UPI0013D2623C|nr:hypothetical protein [Aeromonas rivipollensis]NEX81749.1 hypothetical protein [Aeromonas rivipollensis]
MKKKANKDVKLSLRITEAQNAFLEKQVAEGKAANINQAMQNLINKGMLFG